MHVLFVEPAFPHSQPRFVRALAGVGARVTGIGERPAEALPPELHDALYAYERVRSVVDEDALGHAVGRVQAREWVDRLEATVEAHVLPAARVREACTIPGTSVRTAWLCRDKPSMKEVLRGAGVPCAQSAAASSADEARSFAHRVGFPVVVKPRSSAGAADTRRIDDAGELEAAIAAHGLDRGASVAIEEFVEGHEGFYDTVVIGGEVAHDFVSHYYPGVLESLRERWISPYLVTSNRIDAPGYAEVERLGERVIDVFDIGTSATHMEWFFGPKGLRFSEIGCRPPGVSVWDLYSAANEIDLYHEWAMAIVHGRTDRSASRRFSAGMINLRPDRDGVIAGYEGIDEVRAAIGEWILDAHLPSPGSPTQPLAAGYMANAWIRVRHPDYDRLCEMLDWIGRTVQVHAR